MLANSFSFTSGTLRLNLPRYLSEGDVFGEMALFDQEVRSATVRARGEVWALTLEKKTFLRRIHEDPSLVFNILVKMSRRIRELNDSLKKALGRGSTLR